MPRHLLSAGEDKVIYVWNLAPPGNAAPRQERPIRPARWRGTSGQINAMALGAPAADGVHCKGSCTLQNVWWEDVGEDAATFRGSSSSNVYTVSGGGAKSASDKVFQFNGAGTLNVSNFAVQNFGTFVRSCGNCSTQYKRTINLNTIEATYSGNKLVGINTNYGDSATLKKITIVGDTSKKIVPCQKYIGNNTGAEPPNNGSGPDGTYCKYSSSDITYK